MPHRRVRSTSQQLQVQLVPKALRGPSRITSPHPFGRGLHARAAELRDLPAAHEDPQMGFSRHRSGPRSTWPTTKTHRRRTANTSWWILLDPPGWRPMDAGAPSCHGDGARTFVAPRRERPPHQRRPARQPTREPGVVGHPAASRAASGRRTRLGTRDHRPVRIDAMESSPCNPRRFSRPRSRGSGRRHGPRCGAAASAARQACRSAPRPTAPWPSPRRCPRTPGRTAPSGRT